jgi:hypothetical protein
VELGLGVLLDVATAPAEQLFTYGTTLPTDSLPRAVGWLSTPTGVYAAGLGALLLLAAYELVENLRSYRVGFTLTATGLGLSVLLLPLPIPIPQLERLKFVVSLVAIFPLAVGLARALRVDRRVAVLAVLLVASLGGATAFTVLTADDVPSVYIDEPREQVAMSEDEYASVQATAAFVRRAGDGRAATDRVTNRAFETARFNATGSLRARPGGLRTGATYLVVRRAWTDHLVALGRGLRTGEHDTFAVSTGRFERADALRTVVYSTGHTRVYQSTDGFRGVYGANGRAR